MTCQGSIPLDLFIEGGDAPYEAVFTVKNQTPSSALQTPYGPLSTEETVVLKMQFPAPGGGFGVPQPALRFIDPSSTKVAGVVFRVLVKDDDSQVSFRNAIPGQPLPPELVLGDMVPFPFQDPSAFEALISTCSQS